LRLTRRRALAIARRMVSRRRATGRDDGRAPVRPGRRLPAMRCLYESLLLQPLNPLYTGRMATAVKKLDLHVGELVEVDGRRYEVVPAREGDGLTLEPPITPVSELYAERGMKPASVEDFERVAADLLPPDGEG
jgi:hypothetical protein